MPSLPKLSKLLLLTLLLFNSACKDKIEQNNRNFLDKFGSQVNRINDARKQAVFQKTEEFKRQQQVLTSWKDPAKEFGIDGTFSLRSAFMDTQNWKRRQNSDHFLPDVQTLIQGKNYQNTIPEIYDVVYVADNYPKSYKNRQVSFDDINIPSHDYYGIKSNLGKKDYEIINHKILQENIDYLHQHLKTDENKEINLIILKEREEARRKKLTELLMKEKIEKITTKEGRQNKEESQEVAINENPTLTSSQNSL